VLTLRFKMDASVSTEHLHDLNEKQRTYNSAVRAVNYICHKCIILNFKLIFVVFCAISNAFFHKTWLYEILRTLPITFSREKATLLGRQKHLQPPVLRKHLLFLPTCILLLVYDPHDREISRTLSYTLRSSEKSTRMYAFAVFRHPALVISLFKHSLPAALVLIINYN